MIKKAAAGLIVLVAFGIIGVGAYVGWERLTEAGGPDPEQVSEAAQRVEDALDPDVRDEVRRIVADAHDVLNQEIGFGRLGRVDYDEFRREVAEPVAAQVGEVLAEVDDDQLARDLESVIELLTLGVEREDPEALRFAHRVLHDLDYFAFNPDRGEGERYWGATVTLEGENNPAQEYLAD